MDITKGPVYRLFVPSQAFGTSVVLFDLFCATGSGGVVEVHSVIPIVSGTVAITGLIGVDIFLTKTTAVGTGGTAATQGGTTLTAATFTPMGEHTELPAQITARLTPTGGATAGAVISTDNVYTEESNAGSYTPRACMVKRGFPDYPSVQLKGGTGIRVVQNAVASVGSIAFDVVMQFIRR